ncbi:MAG TPA: hypothetical protein PKE69_06595 [Pyrinomonadaceae bacterium]|nr:hypothetical protein [Pyrinomonadaceae bacterium]
MKFKEIVSRISGISVPIFGLQWTPIEPEITKARRIITFLEDRRVLYTPERTEVLSECVNSVLEIRKFLTIELGNLDSNTELAKNLRAMRSAGRKFLDRVKESEHSGLDLSMPSFLPLGTTQFFGDLGMMRGIFGLHIALIAASYGLDVEDDLASILPAVEEHQERGLTELKIDQEIESD